MENTDESDYEAEVSWYCRENYHHEMLKRAKEITAAYSDGEYLKLLLAIGYTLIGRNHECVQQVSQLLDTEDSSLGALFVQSIAYRSQDSSRDRSTLTEIDARIREERRKASPLALARAANVLFHLKKMDKAREYADRAYKTNPNDTQVLLSNAWIYLYSFEKSSNSSFLEKARSFVSSIPKNNSKDLDVVLVTAKIEEQSGNHERSISSLNSLIVARPKLSIPLIEKMRNQLAIKDWDQVVDTANRVLSINPNSIDSIKAKAFVTICKIGDCVSGLKIVQSFFRNLTVAEPGNVDMFIDNVQLFSRITNKDMGILVELVKATEKTMENVSSSSSASTMVELGNICVLMKKLSEAENWYKKAVRIDESSFAALAGLAHCQILDTRSPTSMELARQQVDFLSELEPNSQDVKLFLMSAKLAIDEPDKALENLARGASKILNLTDCRKTLYGYQYLKNLNPLLCLEFVREYLVHAPHRVVVVGTSNSRMENNVDDEDVNEQDVQRSMCLLMERVVDACPGMEYGHLALAKVRIQAGQMDRAIDGLRKFLEIVDPTNSAAHLLSAQILAHQEQYDLASQSLEIAASFNFRVRDDPIYHLTSSIVDRHRGDVESCAESLRMGLTLMKNSGDSIDDTTNVSSFFAVPISTSDKATLYLELVAACGKLKRFNEANSLMEEAKTLFARSSEKTRVSIVHADLSLEMGNVDGAIKSLMEVEPGKPYYLEAHTKLAQVHLDYRKDRHAFANCFRELVEYCPDPRTYSLLGDAYISIQEPERAIEAYEQSLTTDPTDKLLADKMGKALVKTHQYVRAIGYYREVVKNKSCTDLKLDLAELYMRVKQFDKAETTLVQELQDSRGPNDLPSLDRRVRHLLLLAKIRERAGNVQSALTTLNEARENQMRCLQRSPMGSSLITGQKQILATICLDMADQACSIGDYNRAIGHYKEALAHQPSDVKALLSLTKLYMQVNDHERCRQTCSALLNADPSNEAASVIMADLAFRKVDFETAAFHFRQLLVRRPTYWTALARLIEVSRRTGNMNDLKDWLKRGSSAMEGSNNEPGFYYCSGLLDWRTGKLNSALRNFNSARRDPEWGQQAIYNMIEICLDPDDDSSLSSEAFNDDDAEYQDSRTMALKTAQRLLLELSPKGNAHEMLTHRLLGNFFLLATKQKSNIERALQDCTNLASQENLRDHVGPALGLAMCHILMKQTPRARNHLKRVSKNVWTFEDAEYLERCWLLLSDIYVQSNKYDMANDLLKRVLQHNATCVRAHELSGHIAEREQNYREAASRYQQAWQYGGRTKLSVGYKLAYCSSKCKSYADAIKVCHQVLAQNPDFPRIKKDILEKSINNIRS